jgi:spoIIIJ-associated protein
MSQNKREVEVRGTDVDAAIEKGLAQLGVGRNDVIIEVVDEGSKGLLGIGSRDAVVRLTSMVAPPQPKPKVAPKPVQEKVISSPKSSPPPSSTTRSENGDGDGEQEQTDEKEVAASIIREMLNKMGIEADVSTRLTEPDDVTGRRLNVIEINGDDLGVLIGPRGETLNSLQFITRLMAGHKLRERANFVIDVQGYRQRREQALARLAERMAQKVAARRRPVSLEPMPPHERRIIHMTLRNDKDVYTQSTGEGKRRKVRILPK